MSKTLKGSLMVITAGIAWGFSGVSGQYLMAHGVNVNLLTSLRLLLSGILLTASVFFRQRDKLVQAIKDRKTLVSIALFALFGLVLNQYAYLSAIQYTNAGTATVLQYVTPVIILAFVCAKYRRFPTAAELVAITMAIVGTFIIATHGQLTELAITPLGLFWGLFGLVFIGTVFAYTIFLKGTTMVGAVKGSLLASVEPVASVILTVLIMGDHFFAIDVVGMILIVLAVIIISLKNLVALKKQGKIQR